MERLVVVFLILSLVVYRLTSLLVNEDGPFDIFLTVRKAVGVTVDASGQTIGYKSLFAKLFTCVRCMSIWVAVPFAIYLAQTSSDTGGTVTPVVLFFVFDFALSSASIIWDAIAG